MATILIIGYLIFIACQNFSFNNNFTTLGKNEKFDKIYLMLLLEGDIFMRKVQSFYGGIEVIALHHFHLRRRGHNSSAIQGRAAIGLYENREGIWQLTPFIQPTLTNTERMHWGGKYWFQPFGDFEECLSSDQCDLSVLDLCDDVQTLFFCQKCHHFQFYATD